MTGTLALLSVYYPVAFFSLQPVGQLAESTYSGAGFGAEGSFGFTPRICATGSLEINFGLRTRSVLAYGLNAGATVYLWGGLGTQGGKSYLTSFSSPKTSVFAFAGLAQRSFNFPDLASQKGDLITITDTGAVAHKDSFVGPAFSLGAETLLSEKIRIGLNVYSVRAAFGLSRMDLSIFGVNFRISLQQ